MKQVIFLFLLTLLMSMVGARTFARIHKIGGIYYDLDGAEAHVHYGINSRGDRINAYEGVVVIPEYVTYNEENYCVTSIRNNAFEGCSGLTSVTIPNSVTSIGNNAFQNCNSLTSVMIPNSVTSIGYIAFDGTGWYNNQPDGILYLDNWLIGYKGEKPTGELMIAEETRGIVAGAFKECRNLTSVTIPNSLTSIGVEAFSHCGLTSVHISDIDAWCKISFGYYDSNPLFCAHHLFLGGEEVKDLVIPNSVTSIGGYAFSYCSGLTSVTIPNSVTSIGRDAFTGTTWYNNQPDGLVYAGKVAYRYKGTMPENTKIILEEGTLGIAGFAFSGYGLTSITIPNSVTSIGDEAFAGCSGLTSVTIPSSVTSIGYSAFNNCRGLTSVTIGNSVTSIGGYAFSHCSGLTSITIPNSVTSIGGGGFLGLQWPDLRYDWQQRDKNSRPYFQRMQWSEHPHDWQQRDEHWRLCFL